MRFLEAIGRWWHDRAPFRPSASSRPGEQNVQSDALAIGLSTSCAVGLTHLTEEPIPDSRAQARARNAIRIWSQMCQGSSGREGGRGFKSLEPSRAEPHWPSRADVFLAAVRLIFFHQSKKSNAASARSSARREARSYASNGTGRLRTSSFGANWGFIFFCCSERHGCFRRGGCALGGPKNVAKFRVGVAAPADAGRPSHCPERRLGSRNAASRAQGSVRAQCGSVDAGVHGARACGRAFAGRDGAHRRERSSRIG
jgi:hypothetical protein